MVIIVVVVVMLLLLLVIVVVGNKDGVNNMKRLDGRWHDTLAIKKLHVFFSPHILMKMLSSRQ